MTRAELDVRTVFARIRRLLAGTARSEPLRETALVKPCGFLPVRATCEMALRKFAALSDGQTCTILGGQFPFSSETPNIFFRDDAVFELPTIVARAQFKQLLEQLKPDEWAHIWHPHPLCSSEFSWVPSTEELLAITRSVSSLEVVQYSSDFDRSGRAFLSLRRSRTSPTATLSSSDLRGRTVNFYFWRPSSSTHSSRVLATQFVHELGRAGMKVRCYGFNDHVGVDGQTQDDIFIGHPGSWLREAREFGARHVLMYTNAGPFVAVKNNPEYESNATLAEQYRMCDGIIVCCGPRWRYATEWPEPHKLRWFRIGLDRRCFPRMRLRYSNPGRRKFLFINLYDDAQKGADIAAAVARLRPNYEFIAIGPPIAGRNIRNLGFVPNGTRRFAEAVASADFVLCPSRVDAEPATVLECTSIGLLPVVSGTTGHVVSVPRPVEENTPEAWVQVLDELQAMPSSDLDERWRLMDRYLDECHSWPRIRMQLVEYVCEILSRTAVPSGKAFRAGGRA